MKHILTPTDFSERSAIAGERALDLAALSGARVTFLHVVDDQWPESMVAAAKREAEALASKMTAGRSGVKVERLVRVGQPETEMNAVADEIGADLLVFGAHRKAPLRNTFVGTTAERALRLCEIPALIVRRSGQARYARPLAALDLAHYDLEPWRRAVALDIVETGQAQVVFAYDADTLHDLRKTNPDVKGFETFFQDERKLLLPTVAQAMSDIGLKPEQAHLASTYFSKGYTIVDIAKREKADLIIVGARQRSAIRRLMLGSVSAEILRSAEIDVLVVPPV